VAGHLFTSLDGIGSSRISPVHCVLTRHGAGGWDSDAAWNGWHTVVVAPEDAWRPGLVATDLTYGHSDGAYNGHAAAALASFVGLWTGGDDAPFDMLSAGPLEQPVVGRAFVRRLDASIVAAGLRRELTDLSGGLPRPRHGHAVCEHLSKPEAAGNRTAEAVLHRHAALFALQRVHPAVDPRQRLGALAALRMFLGFIWSVLRRAPWTLLDNARSELSASVSRRLQGAIFGEGDSRYEVVTAGVTGAGLPAAADDLVRSAERLAGRVHTVASTTEQPAPDAGPFWRNVIDGALTLADGGERSSDVPPVMVGALPGVVPHAGFIAPAPEAAFVLPAQLAAVMGMERVESCDIWAQDQVSEHLEGAVSDVETARTTQQIGRRLAQELRTRTAAVADLLRILRETTPEQGRPGPSEDEQRTAVRTLSILVLGLVAIWAIAATVLIKQWLPLRYPIAVAAVVTILWLGRYLLTMYRQQQRIFALLTSRSSMDDRYAAAGSNVGFAIAELHASGVLYQQYSAWAPILGRFLLQPFGAVPQPVRAPRLAGPLPRAMGLGIAQPDAHQIHSVAHELGAVVFDRGWLGSLWNHFADDAHRRLGRAGFALRDNPALLFSDGASTGTSPLRLWSQTVVADGVSGTAGDALWTHARGELLMRGLDRLSADLFANVEVIGQSGRTGTPSVTGSTFLTDLVTAADDEQARHFSTALFDPAAVAHGSHAVDSTVVIGRGADHPSASETVNRAETDLNQFVAVIQVSAPLPMNQLRLLAPLVAAAVSPREGLRGSDDTSSALSYPDLGI
jgi:hypothetical protein